MARGVAEDKAQGNTKVAAQKEETGDVKVTIVTASGKTVYSKKLISFEILVDPNGMIRMLHVVYISGKEKDSHSWYNFDNVENFSYRYYSIRGKGRIKVKRITGPLIREEDKDAVPSLRYEDYR